MKAALLLASSIALSVMGCRGAGLLDRPMPEPETRRYRQCTSDAQCVYATNGCCDCANGGDELAVRRDQLADFRARFQCSGACTEIAGNCGQGRVACEQGLCVYRPPR